MDSKKLSRKILLALIVLLFALNVSSTVSWIECKIISNPNNLNFETDSFDTIMVFQDINLTKLEIKQSNRFEDLSNEIGPPNFVYLESIYKTNPENTELRINGKYLIKLNCASRMTGGEFENTRAFFGIIVLIAIMLILITVYYYIKKEKK